MYYRDSVPKLATSVKPMLDECALSVTALANDVVPEYEYWRWNGMWTFSLRAAVFGVVFVHYLDTELLLSAEGVSEALGSRYVMLWNSI